MAQIGRPGLSTTAKAELWRRWRNGESLSDIGRALAKHAGSIHGVVALRGGISPPALKRSRLALSLLEREGISRGLAAGSSLSEIASRLGRATSTISREVQRNGGVAKYRAAKADDRAWRSAKRPKLSKLASNRKLKALVAEKLHADWSPQQIAGWLKATGRPKSMQVSHETIYRSLYVQTRGVLGRELLDRLRSGRRFRRGKTSTTAGQTRGQIVGAVSIHDRPAVVETRKRPGHWEGDLVSGANNTHVATLVERYSRYLVLVKLHGKDTRSVVDALSRKINSLPSGLFLSLTWDRGTELARHKALTKSTGVKVYFCDPHSPWQRASNENANGLLRQYLPDGLSLNTFTQHDLDVLALRMNRRPRKILGYLSPRERIIGRLAPTR